MNVLVPEMFVFDNALYGYDTMAGNKNGPDCNRDQ